MPVFRINNRNILFIHIPKTGGTTIEAFLSAYGPMSLHGRGGKLLVPYGAWSGSGHLPLQHFHSALLEAMFERGFFDYAFMIVREPLDRLMSEYRHSQRIGRIDTRLGFNAWTGLELTLARLDPYRRSNHYRPQSEFACLGAEVFHFEDGIKTIVSRVSERLGIAAPASIPHERRSEAKPIDVSPQCRARIRRFYAEDYRMFGYA